MAVAVAAVAVAVKMKKRGERVAATLMWAAGLQRT